MLCVSSSDLDLKMGGGGMDGCGGRGWWGMVGELCCRMNCDSNMDSMVSRSKSVNLEESLKPFANGLLSILSFVICK